MKSFFLLARMVTGIFEWVLFVFVVGVGVGYFLALGLSVGKSTIVKTEISVGDGGKVFLISEIADEITTYADRDKKRLEDIEE